MTEDADVGFHVYCMNGTQKVDVIPWERVPSHMVMEEGMVRSLGREARFDAQ